MLMKQTKSIIEFINRIDLVVNKIVAIGLEITQIHLNRALLRGLRNDFSVPVQNFRFNGKCYSEAVADLLVFETVLERNGTPTALMKRPKRYKR